MAIQKTIVIIGGGASGALTALAILKSQNTKHNLVIIDPNLELGRGLAYVKSETQDLLNVPAEKMSADLDNPSEFVDWLKSKHAIDASFETWPFVPRSLFGEYLDAKIRPFIGLNLKHIKAHVTNLKKKADGYQIIFKNGESVHANALVVCTGYQPAPPPISSLAQFSQSQLPKEILIIGSGLTAIDYWRQHRKLAGAHITFLSRHGFFPLAHTQNPQKPSLPNLRGMSPRQILEVTRSFARLGQLQWPDMADAMRTQATAIWTCWSIPERKQFLRHLKVYWEIIRHRLPESIHKDLLLDLKSGRAEIISGRICGPISETSGVAIYLERGTRTLKKKSFDLILDAKGAKIDQSLGHNQIVGLQACDFGFGYINLGANQVWIVGPSSKATGWETTAIAEIRLQAKKTATEILQIPDDRKNQILDQFFTHPQSVGESYLKHFRVAIHFAWELMTITGGLVVHAIAPYLFSDFASSRVRHLDMILMRRRLAGLRDQNAENAKSSTPHKPQKTA